MLERLLALEPQSLHYRTLQAMESKLDKKIVVKATDGLQESQYEVSGVEAAA